MFNISIDGITDNKTIKIIAKSYDYKILKIVNGISDNNYNFYENNEKSITLTSALEYHHMMCSDKSFNKVKLVLIRGIIKPKYVIPIIINTNISENFQKYCREIFSDIELFRAKNIKFNKFNEWHYC